MIKFSLRSQDIQELLKSDEVREILEGETNAIISKLPSDYTQDIREGKYRLIAEVKTDGNNAFYRNLKTNEMLRALK